MKAPKALKMVMDKVDERLSQERESVRERCIQEVMRLEEEQQHLLNTGGFLTRESAQFHLDALGNVKRRLRELKL